MAVHQGPMPPATLKNRIIREGGRADPVWDTQFRAKFTKPDKQPAVDAPLATPMRTVKPLHEFIGRVEREQELEYMRQTCCCAYHANGGVNPEHRGTVHDIATTLQLLKANQLDATDLSEDSPVQLAAAEHASHHARMTPLAVRLPDEVMPDPETGEPVSVPRYGGVKYIAAMKRLIEWEKWRDACGPLLTARWVPAPDGTVSLAPRGNGTTEECRDIARAVRDRWVDDHGRWPTPDEVRANAQRIVGRQALDDATPEERDDYESSRLFRNEDRDPLRVAFHAENDPEPRRSQYPYGSCWRCDIETDRHRACSVLGTQLFTEFHDRWQQRQPPAQVGYAGPAGLLGLDMDDVRGHEWDD